MRKFGVVWREDGGCLQVKHGFVIDARVEAERMAKLNSGVRFHVLELAGTVTNPPPVVWEDGVIPQDDAPFLINIPMENKIED